MCRRINDGADSLQAFLSNRVTGSRTAEEITFDVRVSKEGVVQEPARGIILRLADGERRVVNEGYGGCLKVSGKGFRA